jgi:hypothetical protein
MRYAIVLSLIFSVLLSPLALAMAAIPAGVPQGEADQTCACCQSAETLRECCCKRDKSAVAQRASCCKAAGMPEESVFSTDCQCPNCPCSQTAPPVHFWSGLDATTSAASLETRLSVQSDLLHTIRWEPRAPVPKAGV